MKTETRCIECGKSISRGIHEFSQELYGYSLCMKDQCLLQESGATAQAIDLYLALKARNFPVKLEYFDGYKCIDIAVPGKLYIEVSGYDYLADWQMISDMGCAADPKGIKIPIILISHDMLGSKQTFTRVVNELSKACQVILKPNCGFPVSCAPPWTPAQLQ